MPRHGLVRTRELGLPPAYHWTAASMATWDRRSGGGMFQPCGTDDGGHGRGFGSLAVPALLRIEQQEGLLL